MSTATWTERPTLFEVIALTICWSATRFSPPRPMSAPSSPPLTSSPSSRDCSPYVTSASTPILASRSRRIVAPCARSSANAGGPSSSSPSSSARGIAIAVAIAVAVPAAARSGALEIRAALAHDLRGLALHRLVRRRRDPAQERQVLRELSPPAHEVLLHDLEQRR